MNIVARSGWRGLGTMVALILVFVTGCVASSPSASYARVLEGTWVDSSASATAVFGSDHQFSLASCNTTSGRWAISDTGTITFSDAVSTLIGCLGTVRYVNVDDTTVWKLSEGGDLTATAADGTVWTFRRQ